MERRVRFFLPPTLFYLYLLELFWIRRYQSRITNQIQRLGVSCDWDRVAFTMSPELSEAVAQTFIQLHDEGIIYRANRLVNWCVQLNTTLSNLEVCLFFFSSSFNKTLSLTFFPNKKGRSKRTHRTNRAKCSRLRT